MFSPLLQFVSEKEMMMIVCFCFLVLRTRDVLRKAKTNLQVSSLVASY